MWKGQGGEEESLPERLCLGGVWDKEGPEVVPGYGHLIFQAEELTLKVSHLSID